jgi:hypothetical protein
MQFGPLNALSYQGRRCQRDLQHIFRPSDSRPAQFRCASCNHVTLGPRSKAPRCAACGRLTTRILGLVKVVLVNGWKEAG